MPFVALLRGRRARAPLLDELKPVNSVLAMGASAAVMAAFVARTLLLVVVFVSLSVVGYFAFRQFAGCGLSVSRTLRAKRFFF